MPRKEKKREFVRFGTIKKYINESLKMRSTNKAVNKLMGEFNTTLKTVITEAGKLAKEDKRNTIMEEDVIPALEKHLGKRHLTWLETVEEIIRQNPTDLGKISKAINDYIDKEQRR